MVACGCSAVFLQQKERLSAYATSPLRRTQLGLPNTHIRSYHLPDSCLLCIVYNALHSLGNQNPASRTQSRFLTNIALPASTISTPQPPKFNRNHDLSNLQPAPQQGCPTLRHLHHPEECRRRRSCLQARKGCPALRHLHPPGRCPAWWYLYYHEQLDRKQEKSLRKGFWVGSSGPRESAFWVGLFSRRNLLNSLMNGKETVIF